jgi:hypothetical protein
MKDFPFKRSLNEKAMYRYAAYGLGLQSELVLPELVPSDVPPEVTVHVGEVAPSPRGKASEANLLFTETSVGKFFIIGNDEIVIQPLPGVEEAQLRLFLLGPVMAMLLQRRGLLVLHASAVAFDGGAVAFLGDTGWGKSTLAGAFQIQGFPLLADDVSAIQMEGEQPVVLPGFPQAKLWPEAATALGYPPEQLHELYPNSSKFGYYFNGSFSREPHPLKAVYILGGANSCHQIVSCQPRLAFLNLIRHSWATNMPDNPQLDRLHFEHCSQLVRQVPIRLLRRQFSLTALPDLVRLIRGDVCST